MPSSTAASAEEAFPQYTGSSPVLHMESSDLFHWLRKIGLADYCTGLWKAGFHNLASVTSLTKDQFKRAGVKNSRICSRLMQECGKLKSGKTHLVVESGDIQILCCLRTSNEII